MNRIRIVAALIVASLALAGGCKSKPTTFYSIQDGSTGKSYLTTEYKQSPDGQVEFTDDISGKKMTILNAGIRQLDEGQYDDLYRTSKGHPGTNPTP
jgi:hypothetical protein